MSLAFTCKYTATSGTSHNYLAIPDCGFTDGGAWSAIYWEQASTCPTEFEQVRDMLVGQNVNGQGTSFQKCWIIYFGAAWDASADFASIAQAIGGMVQHDNDRSKLIWLRDSTSLTGIDPKLAIQLPFTPTNTPNNNAQSPNYGSETLESTLITPESYPLFPPINLNGINQQLFIYRPVGERSDSAWGQRVWLERYTPWSVFYIGTDDTNPRGDQGTPANAYSIALCTEPTKSGSELITSSYPANPSAWYSYTNINFQNGSIIIRGVAHDAIYSFCPEIRYSLNVVEQTQAADPASLSLRYPLFKADDWKNWVRKQSIVCLLSPSRPDDPAANYINLETTGAAIPSAFRTRSNKVVSLTPLSGKGITLVFEQTLDGVMYLALTGSFKMSVEGEDESELLCGLSGTETIRFAKDDILQFTPGQAAGISAAINSETGLYKQGVALSLSKQNSCSAPWAMILPGDSQSPSDRIYSSQSNQFPLFIPAKDSASGKELDFDPITRLSLPDKIDSKASLPTCFPIVPYSKIAKPSTNILGLDPARVFEAVEAQILAPVRQNMIDKLSPAPPAPTGTGTTYALTPHGHQMTFNDGKWTEIQIAYKSQPDFEIRFAASGNDALPLELQEAFLANQQFLVITDLSKLWGSLQNLKMGGGWEFKLDPAKKSSSGDYRNILLFKSGNFTIRDMAGNPAAWTQYANFNDASHDPDGNFLSNWLVGYLQKSMKLADAGVKGFSQFCDMINDENWNGFLAFKVDVDVGGLPIELQALMAGIDQNLFYAHHLGSERNKVTSPATAGDPYQITSAPFGLIYYEDPVLGKEANHLPSYVSNPSKYLFDVLTLEAIFENSALTYFSNKSMLLMNELFGDKVIPYTDVQDGIYGANNLVLIGSYHKADGTPSYTFQTAKGAVANFYVSSNAFKRVRMSKASMSVVATAKSASGEATAFLSSFGLWGDFNFIEDSAFDLLSYDYLPYQGLTLEMAFDRTLSKGKTNPGYTFDSQRLTLALNQTSTTASVPPDPAINVVRAKSLVAEFPLKLKTFINGAANKLPKTKGYRLLTTNSPKNISLTSPAVGPWYGLEFDLNLGGQGALGSNHGLSAKLLLAWTPGGKGTAKASPQFQLSGPNGASLAFDLESVLKFGAKDIILNKIDSTGTGASPDQFIMLFESAGVTLLGRSFPPEGSTNIALFGDMSSGGVVHPTLGWFGGYVSKAETPKKVGGS